MTDDIMQMPKIAVRAGGLMAVAVQPADILMETEDITIGQAGMMKPEGIVTGVENMVMRQADIMMGPGGIVMGVEDIVMGPEDTVMEMADTARLQVAASQMPRIADMQKTKAMDVGNMKAAAERLLCRHPHTQRNRPAGKFLSVLRLLWR